MAFFGVKSLDPSRQNGRTRRFSPHIGASILLGPPGNEEVETKLLAVEMLALHIACGMS